MEHFFSQVQVKTKKKSLPKLEHFFPRILLETCAQMHTQARSQKIAIGGLSWGSGGGAPSRRGPTGVWERSPQLPEAGGLGAPSPAAGGTGSEGEFPSARKFCIFLQT